MIGKIRDYLQRRNINPLVGLGYLGLVALFAWTLAQFYIPGKGFTYFIAFGSNQEVARLSKVRKLDYYLERASDGYDAQYYVQIAMDPSLQNKQLPSAVDSLPYRARRILFPAAAYCFGWGNPAWILQVYALQNALCWFLLAAILLHWFPPRSWNNFFRWAGVLLSFGVCVSLRNALVDGPSLLLIALGIFLAEKNRPGWSTAVLAVGGLGKETNLLGAASLLPGLADGRRAWGLAVLRGLLVAAPLVLWLRYLSVNVGPAMDTGARNFDLPFVAYAHKWSQVLAELPEMTWPNFGALWGLLMLVSLTVQFLFILLRPQWSRAWWRVGLSFALLMAVLGDAVWEGYPGAASRVLLPMQLAFNILVPVGRGWTLVLVLGNLTLLSAPAALQSPPGGGYLLKGPSALLSAPNSRSVRVELSPEWYGLESSGANYWVWSPGTAAVTVYNPHHAPLLIRLRFSLSASSDRTVWVRVNGAEAWRVAVSEDKTVSAILSRLVLAPGNNRIEFATDLPPRTRPPDARQLTFCLHNLRFDLQELQTAPAPKGN